MRRMAVKKVSISVDETLLEEARKVAGARGLSSFVNDALRVRLQHERLRRLLDEMDAEHGPVPEEEIARARKLWPGKKKKSRRAA
jgi:Arc/MetJ family transcription regulator